MPKPVFAPSSPWNQGDTLIRRSYDLAYCCPGNMMLWFLSGLRPPIRYGADPRWPLRAFPLVDMRQRRSRQQLYKPALLISKKSNKERKSPNLWSELLGLSKFLEIIEYIQVISTLAITMARHFGGCFLMRMKAFREEDSLAHDAALGWLAVASLLGYLSPLLLRL